MNCLNLKLSVPYNGKEVELEEVLNDLTSSLGSKAAAYATLSANNGQPLDRTQTGKVSKHYAKLQAMTGNNKQADILRAVTFSAPFRAKFGDWINDVGINFNVDSNNEPKLIEENGLFYYYDKKNLPINAKPNTDYTDATPDSLYTKSGGLPNTQRIKDFAAANNLLSTSIIGTNDSNTALSSLLNIAEEIGVLVNKKVGNATELEEVGTHFKLTLDKALENSSKEEQVKIIFRNVMQAYSLRRYNNASKAEQAEIDLRLGKLQTAFVSSAIPAPQVKNRFVELTSKGTYKTIQELFSNTKLIDYIYTIGFGEEYYNALTYAFKIPNTNAMKSIFDVTQDQLGALATKDTTTSKVVYNDKTFANVEQAYQWVKVTEYFNVYSIDPGDEITTPEMLHKKVKELADKILQETDIVKLKSLGHSRIPVDFEDYMWDEDKKELRKTLETKVIKEKVAPKYKQKANKLVNASTKQIVDLTAAERDTAIRAQATINPKGEIKVGSTVKYSTNKTFNKGYSDLVVTAVDASGNITAIKYKTGKVSIIRNNPPEFFQKTGDYHVIEEMKDRESPLQTIVLPFNNVYSITNNKVQKEDAELYINKAIQAGLNTAPKVKSTTSDLIEELDALPVTLNGVQYKNTADAYNSLIAKEPADTVVEVTDSDNAKRLVPYSRALLESILYQKLVEASKIGTVVSNYDFADISFDMQGTPKEWNTSKDTNMYIDALKSASANFNSAITGESLKLTLKNKQALDNIAIGEKTSVTVTKPAVTPDIKIGGKLLMRGVEGEVIPLTIQKVDVLDKTLTIHFVPLKGYSSTIIQETTDTNFIETAINAAVNTVLKGDSVHAKLVEYQITQIITNLSGQESPSIDDVALVTSMIANTANQEAAERLVISQLRSTKTEVAADIIVDAISKVHIAMNQINTTLPNKETPINNKKKSSSAPEQYTPEDKFALEASTDISDADLASMKTKVLNAINSKVKTFITIPTAMLSEAGIEKTTELINLVMKSGAYSQVLDDSGLMRLVLKEKSTKEFVKKKVEKIVSKVPVTQQKNKKVRTMNFEDFTPTAFVEYLENHKDYTIHVKNKNTKIITLLKNVLKENGKFPDNLTISEEIKNTLIIKEEVAAVGTQVNGKINIRGTIIDLASIGINFDPSPDQVRVLNSYADWMASNSTKPFSIEGIAGTGKSTMLRIAREYAIYKGKRTAFTASTHAAVRVLEKAIGAEASTLHSLLGLAPSLGNGKLNFETDKEVPARARQSVIFIDEISMISNKMTKETIDTLTKAGSKVVFVGNKSQLPPVGTGDNTIAFNPAHVELNTLTQVRRQGESNPALPFFKVISMNQSKDFTAARYLHKDMFYNDGEGVFVHYADETTETERFNTIVLKAAKAAKGTDNTSAFRVIAYRKKEVARYNKAIRMELGMGNSVFAKDDTVFLNELPLDDNAKKGLIYRTDRVEVEEIMVQGVKATVHHLHLKVSPKDQYLINGEEALKDIVVTVLADGLANRKAIEAHVVSVKYLEMLAEASLTKRERIARTKTYLEEKAKFLLTEDVTEKVDTKWGKKDRIVIDKGIYYSYASTVHKTQGATFDEAFVDEASIWGQFQWMLSSGKSTEAQAMSGYNKAMYTAVTRARLLTRIKSHLSKATTTIGTTETTEAAQNRLNEDINKTDEDVLNSMRVTLSPGVVVNNNSFEHKARKVLDKTNETASNKITAVMAKPLTDAIDVAIMNAVPNEVIIEDISNRRVTRANRELRQSIVTDPNDPRLGKLDIDTYNKVMFDAYTEDVMKGLNESLTETQIAANPEDVLNIRSDNALIKNRSQIKALKEQVQAYKNMGKRASVIEVLEDDIKTLVEINAVIDTVGELESLKKSAEFDLAKAESILAEPNISQADYTRVKRSLDIWIKAGDFSNPDNHNLLTPSEARDAVHKKELRELAVRATDLYPDLEIKGKKLLMNDSSENLSTELSSDSLTKLKGKVTWFGKLFNSIAKIDNPIIAHVMKLINEANNQTNIAAITESKVLADKYKKFKDEGFDENLFWQVSETEILTGKLVSEYTQKFQEIVRQMKWKNGSRQFNIFKNTTIILDPSNPESSREELIKEVGEGRAEELIQEAKDKWTKYKEVRNEYYNVLFGFTHEEIRDAMIKKNKNASYNTNITTSIMKEALLWNSENSPATRRNAYANATSYMEMGTDIGSSEENSVFQPSDPRAEQYMVIVPKKHYKGKFKDTGYYDNNYMEIQKSPSAKDFLEEATRITKSARANFGRDDLSDYALSTIARETGDEWREHGIGKVTRDAVADKLIGQFTGGYTKQKVIDPLTGQEYMSLKPNVITLEEAIRAEVQEIKLKEYPGVTILRGEPLEKVLAQATKNVMKKDKGDIFLALNNLNLAALSYKHKMAIKPSVDLAMNFARNMTPGESRARYGREITSEDINKALELTEDFVNKELYDSGSPDESYKLPFNKILTSKEKESKKYYQERIKEIKDKKGTITEKETKALEEYEDKLEKLGSFITTASILDAVMSGARYAMIGWGFQAGIINVLHGQLANVIMAADGTHYGLKDLKASYGLITHGESRKKFKKVLSNYSLLGDIMYDFNKTTPFSKNKTGWGKTKEALKPFHITKITEQGNQGVLMVAIMLKTKVTDVNTGETLSMWEALNEDGTLEDNFSYKGKVGAEAVNEQVTIIREQVALIHGDYTNPKMVQNIPAGRALTMFKLWFFDPFMVRFGAHKYNYILGKETKGRYITTLETLLDFKFNVVKIHKAIKEKSLSPVDLENFRTLAAEASIVLSLFLVQLLAKAMMCKETNSGGEDCGKATYAINLGNRLNSELQTFVTPSGYYDLISNPFAVARYLKLMDRFGDSLQELTIGGKINDAEEWTDLGGMIFKEIPLARRLALEKSTWEDYNYMYE